MPKIFNYKQLFRQKSNTEDFKSSKGFEKIYRKYFKKIYGICYYQTNDENLAQDMTQDIFLSLWRRKDDLIIKVPIDHYLVRAAKLEVMSYYRTTARRKKKQQVNNMLNYTEIDNSTEDQIIYNELELEIDSLINKLPKQGKKVFKLSREKGMSNKEIAATLGITEKGVEYHITKALYCLRENLVISLQ